MRAYVVLKQTSVTEEELMHYCTLHLAKYKVPMSIEFLTELPKNTTGKLLRRAVERRHCKYKNKDIHLYDYMFRDGYLFVLDESCDPMFGWTKSPTD